MWWVGVLVKCVNCRDSCSWFRDMGKCVGVSLCFGVFVGGCLLWLLGLRCCKVWCGMVCWGLVVCVVGVYDVGY